jgi:alkylation response protein AidB-like acyl-CoA dehydrogenase
MDFTLDIYQELLQRSAHTFLARECPIAHVRDMEMDPLGYSPELFSSMAAMGWQGILVPAEFGGSANGAVDVMLLCREAGRALLPAPFVSTAVVGASLLVAGGVLALRQRLMPRIVAGAEVIADALFEEGVPDATSVTTAARRVDAGHVLTGRKVFVRDAEAADHLLVLARTGRTGAQGDLTAFLVDSKAPGVKKVALKAMDGSRLFDVTFDEVHVGPEYVLGDPGGGWDLVQPAVRLARIAVSAEMIGGARRILEMSTEYAQQRRQFGKPIGVFQTIQHKLADLFIQVDSADLVLQEAAYRLGAGLETDLEVFMAKLLTAEAYYQAVHTCSHIHGGYGYMKIHDSQLFFRRAKALELAYGDPDFCREQIARLRFVTPHPLGNDLFTRWWDSADAEVTGPVPVS